MAAVQFIDIASSDEDEVKLLGPRRVSLDSNRKTTQEDESSVSTDFWPDDESTEEDGMRDELKAQFTQDVDWEAVEQEEIQLTQEHERKIIEIMSTQDSLSPEGCGREFWAEAIASAEKKESQIQEEVAMTKEAEEEPASAVDEVESQKPEEVKENDEEEDEEWQHRESPDEFPVNQNLREYMRTLKTPGDEPEENPPKRQKISSTKQLKINSMFCTNNKHKTSPFTQRTASRQSTIPAIFRDNIQKNSPFLRNHYQDTPTVWYLHEGFQEVKAFKLGETFQTDKEEWRGMYFTILGFQKTLSLKKEAVCLTREKPNSVSIDLEQTFLKENAKLLSDSIEWQNQQPHDSDKAIYASASQKLKNQRSIPLYLLTRRRKEYEIGKVPKPSLIWECDKMAQSSGFNCAYYYELPKNCEPRKPPRIPVVLELFAGCGGMSLGFKKAGFNVKYLVDKDPHAAGTLRMNLKDENARVFNEDVDTFLKRGKNDEVPGYYPKRGDVDHVHASSPCQGFSDANRNGGKNDVKNNKLSYRFVDAMRELRPPTGSFENVPGMTKQKERTRENELEQDDEDEKNNREYLQKIIADLLILGYQVRVCILTSSDYGDPQKRHRVVLFAALKGWKLPDIPKSTEINPFREALRDLVDLDPVEGNGIVKLPTGAIVYDHSIDGTDLKTENDHLSQVQGDFAPTVRRQRGIKHHVHPRGLTVRERARIQSFPDDYQFAGSMRDKLNQIGNAVPVKLATAVAQSIMESHKL